MAAVRAARARAGVGEAVRTVAVRVEGTVAAKVEGTVAVRERGAAVREIREVVVATAGELWAVAMVATMGVLVGAKLARGAMAAATAVAAGIEVDLQATEEVVTEVAMAGVRAGEEAREVVTEGTMAWVRAAAMEARMVVVRGRLRAAVREGLRVVVKARMRAAGMETQMVVVRGRLMVVVSRAPALGLPQARRLPGRCSGPTLASWRRQRLRQASPAAPRQRIHQTCLRPKSCPDYDSLGSRGW